MTQTRRKKNGFTLIELIIVIGILAILALIGLPMIGQYISDAQTASNNATAQVIGRAAEAYIAAHPGTTSIDYSSGILDNYLNSNARGLSGVTVTVTAGSVSVTGPGTGDGQGHYPAEPTT